MASASTLPFVEPPAEVLTQTTTVSIESPVPMLTGRMGEASVPQQFSPAIAEAGSANQKWYQPRKTAYSDSPDGELVSDKAPNLTVYIPAPTTAGALITLESTLDPLQATAVGSSIGQQVDPPPEDDVIVVTGPDRASPIDPLANVNAEAFQLGQDFDQALMEPVANAYKDTLPKPVRSGIRNFLNNLAEPIVFLNYLLQLKPGKALETLGRFTINSTIGIGGLVDVAKKKPFYLPHRRNGFANTLGYYGVESGSYLYLPIIGATTVRDLVGDGLDLLVLPTAVGKPFNQAVYTAPAGVLRALDRRVELDDQIREIQEESADPYVAQREFYLRTRQMEIDVLKGLIPDPLSRKTVIAPVETSGVETRFQYEVADLWYLPSSSSSELALSSGAN